MSMYGVRGLENERPSVRARSFDVVFNLAVHAELLYPSRTTTIDIEAEVNPPPLPPPTPHLLSPTPTSSPGTSTCLI